MKSLHGTNLSACFHRLVDLLIESLPIIERTDLQKFEQGVELLDIILPVINVDNDQCLISPRTLTWVCQ
jgi:hypothetical protein